MNYLEAWLNESSIHYLRKLMVFADFKQIKDAHGNQVVDDDGAPAHEVGRWRACAMVGRSNEVMCVGMGDTVVEALEALDAELASDAGRLLQAGGDDG